MQQYILYTMYIIITLMVLGGCAVWYYRWLHSPLVCEYKGTHYVQCTTCGVWVRDQVAMDTHIHTPRMRPYMDAHMGIYHGTWVNVHVPYTHEGVCTDTPMPTDTPTHMGTWVYHNGVYVHMHGGVS